MAAQVEIVLNAIDKSQGALRKFGQDWKTVGATVGVATGIMVAANAALDGMESRLRELDMTDQADSIAAAQAAWQALGDTLLTTFVESNIFQGIISGLQSAGTAASQLFFIFSVGSIELKKNLGLLTEQEAAQDKLALATNYTTTQVKSQNAEYKKQRNELEKINEQMEEAIKRRDPEAMRKARKERAKFAEANPAAMKAIGGTSVTIVGGGMRDVVTEIIIDGVSTPIARDTDKSAGR